MRPYPLIGLSQGINRLRIKGGASPKGLYDLTNAYINQEGVAVIREGTNRAATLDDTTIGLVYVDGTFNVFAIATPGSLPAGYQVNLLIHPTIPAEALSKIWYAQPFMGFLYVVAEFANGDIFHYWLQNNGTWTADTVYMTGNIVLPVTPNGLAYIAVRDTQQNPLWAPNTVIALDDIVEPNEYTGYMYKATAVSGSPVVTGSVEPTWPTVVDGQVQEFGNFSVSTTSSITGATGTAGPTPLGTSITDRYGNSADVAGSTTPVTTDVTTVEASTNVGVWTAGTTYQPGATVRPTTGQGAYIDAVPNGDFEAGDDGNWTLGTGWTITDNADDSYQGDYFAAFSNTGSGFYDITMYDYGTVTPGQAVTATMYARGDSDGAVFARLSWYDDTDTFISAVLGDKTGGTGTNPGVKDYVRISVTGTAPANAVHCRAGAEYQTGSSSARAGALDLVNWNLEEPSAVSNFIYEAVQSVAGTSASTEPSWPTSAGDTVVDGGVTWEAVGTSIITWEALPLMESGDTEPTWPTTVGVSVADGNMSWTCTSRQITDTNCPNGKAVIAAASHIFCGSDDITSYSAAVNPTDWTSANNAGYLPTGLNTYGNNPVEMLGLFRSNLVVFNGGGYQMWEIDPDPANMAILDGEPVGSPYTRSGQAVANDFVFLSEVGFRNLEIVGLTANLQIGNTGQPVDPIAKARINTDAYDPISLYYPGRGQYWGFWGAEALVLTTNGSNQKFWSRYIFPDVITDWTLAQGVLYLRSAGNLVWEFSDQALNDDVPSAPIEQVVTVTAGSYASEVGYDTANHGSPYANIGSISGTTSAGTIWGLFIDSSAGPSVFLYMEGEIAQDAFTSITIKNDNASVTLNSADAIYPGGGGTSWTLWRWNSISGAAWTATDAYDVTFTLPAPGTNTVFSSTIQWPYVDMGALGINKMLVGIDLVGDGACDLQIGFDESDDTTFSDNAGFSTSAGVTPSYDVSVDDTVPGTPIPMPINAPSVSVILTFASGQQWTLEAVNLYIAPTGGAGATG